MPKPTKYDVAVNLIAANSDSLDISTVSKDPLVRFTATVFAVPTTVVSLDSLKARITRLAENASKDLEVAMNSDT